MIHATSPDCYEHYDLMIPRHYHLQGYVMTYNKVIGKVRLRQLRVSPDTGTECTTENLIIQTDTTRSGQEVCNHECNPRRMSF